MINREGGDEGANLKKKKGKRTVETNAPFVIDVHSSVQW